MTGRILLASGGVAAGAYGVVRLLELGLDNLLATVTWLAGAVLLHDAVLAPVTITVCALAMRLIPSRLRPPAAAGLLILGSLTLAAIPVLGRFGARADNGTLLDRDYLQGWFTVTVVTVLAVAVAMATRRRRVSPAQPPEQ